jgi:RecG-like helicase
LFVVRDLVHYYPRDYLDYANLVRIAGLEPGRTATIVATVQPQPRLRQPAQSPSSPSWSCSWSTAPGGCG